MRSTFYSFCAAMVAVSVVSGIPQAQAADPAVKCEASKLKESAKYCSCRLKAESKGVKKGLPADFTKCETKFTEKFNKAETNAGPGICPSEADEPAINARITLDAADVATLLTGGAVSVCGNAIVEAGEACDFGDLDGETCVTQGLFGTGLACTPGTCVFDTSGCAATRYEDTGLGSVVDHQTGLEWQKTDDAGGLTDKDNSYGWSASFSEPDGTAFTQFLFGLNACESGDGATVTGGYAGHCDWRMPQIDELLTTIDCSFGIPCIDQVVFGPTRPTFHWSSLNDNFAPDSAWVLNLGAGNISLTGKSAPWAVRAVRGGS